ncbi:uncharacterized protein PV09_04716 [Verruconis gallopava]|uniref:HD/PDEase domain-containing protein n=1 Tax=Verruconis gallopava TaxID=253628 RepID=A0A0D1XPG5_9PEZI|nr:uncharacterized protein PV09_04716 [Verruconis gallopava]KIW04451.1 hypothetical protein PV09_04716 [Verruconis gallopava]
MDAIIEKSVAYVKDFMSRYDASHDFSHVQRVLQIAKTIEAAERKNNPTLPIDTSVITLAALLHDVGDRKYLKPGEEASVMVSTFLSSIGCPQHVADKVQLICTNVSYSNEIRNEAKVAKLCEAIPELRIVQDADRIDAIGAVGLARMFVFTGAKQHERGFSVEHVYEKLLHIEKRMKTKTGISMAKERTARMETFLSWWDDEICGLGKEKGH